MIVLSHKCVALQLWKGALLVVLCCGCSRAPTQQTFDEASVRELGELPGARASDNGDLVHEIEAVEKEAWLPAQLTAVEPPSIDDNLWIVLRELFPRDETVSLAAETEGLFRAGRFDISPSMRGPAVRLGAKYVPQLKAYRFALARKDCDFQIDYRLGFTADRSFVDVCTILVNLDCLSAAEHLEQGDVTGATARIGDMLVLIGHLSRARHVEARLEAARLRRRVLAGLKTVVGRPALGREEVSALAARFRDELAGWPGDADAWIGDRAQTLPSYEIARQGGIDMLLTEEERKQLQQETAGTDFTQIVLLNIDNDELFYLQAMTRIIDGCRRPFFKRKEMLAALGKDLVARQGTPDYPLLAARLFLPGVANAQRQQAEDRAAMECWTIALALAAGLEPPPLHENPVSGERYKIVQEGTRVLVRADAASDEIVVPAFGNALSPVAEVQPSE